MTIAACRTLVRAASSSAGSVGIVLHLGLGEPGPGSVPISFPTTSTRGAPGR